MTVRLSELFLLPARTSVTTAAALRMVQTASILSFASEEEAQRPFSHASSIYCGDGCACIVILSSTMTLSNVVGASLPSGEGLYSALAK